MVNEGMPINKELIAWARKRAGLTQDEAAQKFAHVAAWEDGNASVLSATGNDG